MTEALALFKWFVKERYSIYVRKERGSPKPWTADVVLRTYRFCNVHRENDTVTRWVSEKWRAPHAKDPDLWFAMCVARLVNWPESLQELGYPAPWNAVTFVRLLEKRAAQGYKVFSGAYIVSTNGHTMPKAQYLAQHVLTPLWEARSAIRPTPRDTLASFHDRLWGFNGMGSFMAAQVVADTKYTSPLSEASDWWTWAASGPGSRRGLNVIRGLPVDTPWGSEARWKGCLDHVIAYCTHDFQVDGIPRLHAQDYQNCLCEFDKYVRVKEGRGRPRSKYAGGA